MDNKRNRLKRGLVLVLTLALVGNGMSHTMLSALAKENEPEVTDVQEDLNEPVTDQPEAEGEPEGADAGQSKTEAEVTSGNTKENEEDKKDSKTEDIGNEQPKKFSETVIPKSVKNLPDNDELFAGYVDQLFFGEQNADISTLADFGKKKLTGINLDSYNILKEEIKKIAVGDKASTVIEQSIAWSAADLGLGNATMEQISDAGYKKFKEEYNSQSIINYLLMDFPYELYWYDKTKGTEILSGFMAADQKYHIEITYKFTVAKGYQGAVNEIDTAKAKSAAAAAENAKRIVEKYQGKSDFEKMDGYRQEICDLTAYNNDAAAETKPVYGDPWQLIWVFDGDTATNVVCEGYSKAFQYLCDLSQFSDAVCYTVTGEMSGGTGAGPHMWNIVTLEGKNYLVDVTNCDEGTIGAPNQLFLTGIDGSVEAGYTFPLYYDIKYTYDADQLGLFGKEILTLASEKYVQKEKLNITPPELTVTYGEGVNRGPLPGGSAITSIGNQKVEGTFKFTSDVTSYGGAGTKELKAVFTPADTSLGFEPQTVLVKVTVNRKPVTVTADSFEKFYGEPEVALTYTVDPATQLVDKDKLSGELSCDKGSEMNVGSYKITQGTLTDDNNPNYLISFNEGIYVIKATDKYKDNTTKEQNIRTGVGKFAEPVFTGVNEEKIAGSIVYTYNNQEWTDYNALAAEIAKLEADVKGTIDYRFVPQADGNYTGEKTGTIAFTITAKLSQDGFKFDTAEVKKTYGDGDFAVVASDAAEGSTVSYESSDPTVATVDAVSGSVHILRKGTVTITATATETEDYVSKSITYTLTVSPKVLTWDVSGLHAVDKQGMVDKDTMEATLYGELRVSGILSADKEKVSFSCPAGAGGKLIGTYADTKPGSKKVTLKWAGEAVVLTGTDVENYTLPDKLPEITGRINAVTEQTNVPESTDTVKYKLEIEGGISQVPAALADNEELNTPVKIEEKMKAEIRVKLAEESNKNSVEVYDVTLMVKDGENDWVVATEENFPKDGITVTLPYPEGTAKDTHNFEIAHMFTHTWNGRTAGEIEYPKASKIDSGVQFKVTSLSPLAIGWKEIKADKPGTNGTTNNTNGTTPNKSRSPQTGDENAVMLYVLLMVLGAAGVGFTMKRRALR
jgi:Uncharacterized protein involved in cytokinesis, contains TGc (transglutaminase/protease-like) domain